MLYVVIAAVFAVAVMGFFVFKLAQRNAVQSDQIRELRDVSSIKSRQLEEAAKPLPDSVAVSKRMRDGKL